MSSEPAREFFLLIKSWGQIFRNILLLIFQPHPPASIHNILLCLIAPVSLAIGSNPQPHLGVAHTALKTISLGPSNKSSFFPTSQLLHCYTQSCCSRVSSHRTHPLFQLLSPQLLPLQSTHPGILLVLISDLSAHSATLKFHATTQTLSSFHKSSSFFL